LLRRTYNNRVITNHQSPITNHQSPSSEGAREYVVERSLSAALRRTR
jgi:hypothetical protein